MFKRKSKSDKPAKAPKPKKEKSSAKKREKPAKAPKPSRKVKAAPLGPVKKQPTDIYTVMLIISMVAVLVGCVLLLLELNRFGSYPWWNAG